MITLVARRAVLDYARRPLNLVLLVAVPVVLVFVWGGTLADFSELLGGTSDRGQIEAATAGWAAAALAGLAGFFQVSSSAAADRRLAAAGHRTAPVVGGRVGAAVGLALLASAGGLVALAARAGIDDPPRAVAATVLFALIYVALGVLVGTLVRSEMNGALLVTLAWVFDVFFGPALGTGSVTLTRLFPLHFPTLVLTDQASGHSGPLGDVGWSLAWAAGLSVVAVARLAAATRPVPLPSGDRPLTALAVPASPLTTSERAAAAPPAPPATAARPVAVTRATPSRAATRRVATAARLAAALRAGMRECRRNRVLWILLLAVPVVFIVLAIAVTPDTPAPVALIDGSRHFTAMLSERRMHAATMVPVTSAFLAGLTGLFVVTGSAGGDRRLVLAGFKPREVLAGRLGVIGAATVLTTTVAVAVAGAWYPPRHWAVFAAANLLIALTYAMVGVLVGPLTGRLGGLYLILLLAFIDVGLGQTIMFDARPPNWGAFLPARGASRVLIDGAFTAQFDEVGYLLLGLAWLTALTAATTAVFHRRTGSKRS
ncbi:MAG: hypothetical protein AB7H92_17340 [Microbacteriaceae bacterium]